MGAVAKRVLARASLSRLVAFLMALGRFSSGSWSTLFSTTSSRSEVISPITKHSAVCACTPGCRTKTAAKGGGGQPFAHKIEPPGCADDCVTGWHCDMGVQAMWVAKAMGQAHL
jgi:hypothetical protein